MNFQLAYTASSEQIILRQFSFDETLPSKIISWDEMKNHQVEGLISQEGLLHEITSELKFFPIRLNTEFNLTQEEFLKLDYSAAKNVYQKMRDNWSLQNNLTLVEEIFKTQMRPTFLRDLHFILLFKCEKMGFFLLYNGHMRPWYQNWPQRNFYLCMINFFFSENQSESRFQKCF